MILLDSASLQEEEYKRWSVKAKTDIDVRKPLFTEQDIEDV